MLVSFLVCHVSMAAPEWTLAKDAEGIRVYTQAVAGSPLREFRGEVDIAATPEQVVRVLKDANSFRKWMPNVVVSELLKSSETDQHHYLENAVPWPLVNRDGVYHFMYSHSDEGGIAVTTVRVEALPDYLPKKDGKVRIPKSDGYWKIIPVASGVKVIWQIHAYPGGEIPAWLVNSTVIDTPFKTLKGLRNFLQPEAKH
ncbi:START domain-containing protein [Undibacterium sp. CY18W]|uniref:START domain-containing protein n=2 Tax=Undibacterium hunanense TaxID=2762292 RepID=A0ABR6ZLF4_9BURK|nr:START domain-containing protein [Undibacterium hunanense]